VEAGAGTIPAGAGEQQGADADDTRQGQQQCAKMIHHQHDAKGRGPVAWEVDADRFGLPLGAYP